MNFYSTRSKISVVDFETALFSGQAAEGGLYMPQTFPKLSLEKLVPAAGDYKELATEIACALLEPELDAEDIGKIIEGAYSFSPKLERLDDKTYVLELWHGPTLSFKDFGAQFMAQSMYRLLEKRAKQLTILVATSGDTGSAVAHAYYRVEGIRIVLLYPADKVSAIQEKQFTTLGDNITAIKVFGSFDDCQALVKRAFTDPLLREKIQLSSANSINIGRLLPQSFYYTWSLLALYTMGMQKAYVCVPSGNFGNLTAGLFAREMAVPIEKFIAAVNSNDVIPDYLATGHYTPRASLSTLSNAMDVGDPSNWERVRDLFKDDPGRIREVIDSISITDRETLRSIQRIHEKYGYIIDPHTAVGFDAVEKLRCQGRYTDLPVIILSTAHPGKFQDIVEQALDTQLDLPVSLQKLMRKEVQKIDMRNDYPEFVKILLE
jgi:threonine synthase